MYYAPRSADLWSNLGACLWHQRDYENARSALERALSLNPEHIIALHNLALVYEACGRPKLAEALLQRVLEKDPTYLAAKWELGLLRLGMGEFSDGFAGYETRVARFVDLTDPEFAELTYWAGQCIKDKAVLIVGEHGVGDSILYSRFIPWICGEIVGAKKVWLLAPEMTSLLWEMRGLVEFLPEDVPPPEADYFLFIGSLPHFYDTYAYCDPPPPRLRTVDDIPPDPGFIRRRIDKEMGAHEIESRLRV